MGFAIITDSTCNLPKSIVERFGLHVINQPYISDGREYVSYSDDGQVDLTRFYDMMRDGKVFTTSSPNLADVEALAKGLFAGGQDILYVGFSSGLSATYSLVSEAIARANESFPGRKSASVDTLAACGGEGLLVVYAAEMRDRGCNLDETARWIEENRLRMTHWFTVDDLMFLYRGGRLSRTSATAGSILSIKPILHVDDAGHLVSVGKTTGRKRSIRALFNRMCETYDRSFGKQHLCITHADCERDALVLREMVEAEFSSEMIDMTVYCIDPVIGAHSGPGTLAVYYLGTSRN